MGRILDIPPYGSGNAVGMVSSGEQDFITNTDKYVGTCSSRPRLTSIIDSSPMHG
jgi:hypothetical protein